MNGQWKTIFATIFIALAGAVWAGVAQLGSLETGLAALSKQVERQDTRWTTRFDQLDNRLRDVEMGER